MDAFPVAIRKNSLSEGTVEASPKEDAQQMLAAYEFLSLRFSLWLHLHALWRGNYTKQAEKDLQSYVTTPF